MQLAFTEEQEELRRSARAFLAEHSSSERVRAAMATELGWDGDAWKRIGAELGWTGVAIPETYGGVGLGGVARMAARDRRGPRDCDARRERNPRAARRRGLRTGRRGAARARRPRGR